jgi:hypothetical protein
MYAVPTKLLSRRPTTQGCQIFLGATYLKRGEIYVPNYLKIYQMAMIHTRWLKNNPNDHKIYQQCPFQGPPKYTQRGIFGQKKCHLATLQLLFSANKNF